MRIFCIFLLRIDKNIGILQYFNSYFDADFTAYDCFLIKFEFFFLFLYLCINVSLRIFFSPRRGDTEDYHEDDGR